MNKKLKEIKSICSSWKGGFISGDSAMYEIADILKYEKIVSTDCIIVNGVGERIGCITQLETYIKVEE